MPGRAAADQSRLRELLSLHRAITEATGCSAGRGAAVPEPSLT